MPEGVGQRVAQQQAKQWHGGLEQAEHYADAQPGPGVDAADADSDSRGKVGQPKRRRDQQERDRRAPYDENTGRKAGKHRLAAWAGRTGGPYPRPAPPRPAQMKRESPPGPTRNVP